jgi:uncharacterized caspase-like protein
MAAIAAGSEETALLLIDHGCKLRIRNKIDENAKDFCEKSPEENKRILMAIEDKLDNKDMDGQRAGMLMSMEEMIEEAVKKNICTYNATKDAFEVQKYWKCEECSIKIGADFAMCEVCSSGCHKKHKKTYVGKASLFCDCGSSGAKECARLELPATSSSSSSSSSTAADTQASIAAMTGSLYRDVLQNIISSGVVTGKDKNTLSTMRRCLKLTDANHSETLKSLGVSEAKFEKMCKDGMSLSAGAVSGTGTPVIPGENPADIFQITQKEALIIGNKDYKTSPLQNTLNDAECTSKILTELGFNIVFERNCKTDKDMQAALDKFKKNLQVHSAKGDVGVLAFFYFAGHAIEINGQNYCLHTQFDNQELGKQGFEKKDLTQEALTGFVSAQMILKQMEEYSKCNILILDACRNNPFKPPPKSMKEKFPAMGKGAGAGGSSQKSEKSDAQKLSEMYPSGNSMICLAAAPGYTSGDANPHNKSNGMFTGALIRHLGNPDLHLEQIMFNVAKDVFRDSSCAQHPWIYSALLNRVYLAKKPVTLQEALASYGQM